jgi:hypothetical protein
MGLDSPSLGLQSPGPSVDRIDRQVLRLLNCQHSRNSNPALVVHANDHLGVKRAHDVFIAELGPQSLEDILKRYLRLPINHAEIIRPRRPC